MQVLCILDSMELMKQIKEVCHNNSYQMKAITPDEDFQDYFECTKPDVVIIQDQYEDLSGKFLHKMIENLPAYQEAFKVLIATTPSAITTLSGFSSDKDLYLVEVDNLDGAFNSAIISTIDANKTEIDEEKHLNRLKTILYVSDNKFMHIVMKDAFAENSIELIDAYDGDEAIKIIKNRHLDLILTDLDIPGITGIDLCKNVKHNPDLEHIPVIIYSSYVKDEVFDMCKAAGANDYFEKNMNPKDFAKELFRFLEQE